jgi:hypothetical protein
LGDIGQSPLAQLLNDVDAVCPFRGSSGDSSSCHTGRCHLVGLPS